MLVLSKYKNHSHPFFSFFKSCFNLIIFIPSRFLGNENLKTLKNKPLWRISCRVESCLICQSICPTKAIKKEFNTVSITQISCVECELCIKRCPQRLIGRQ